MPRRHQVPALWPALPSRGEDASGV